MLHAFERRWIFGGPRDIWIRYSDLVEKIVREGKLTAVPHAQAPAPAHLAEARERTVAEFVRPENIAGGIVGPHVHLHGEVYLLNPEQWRTFSQGMMKEYRARLEHVGTVNFEGLMGVAEAIERL